MDNIQIYIYSTRFDYKYLEDYILSINQILKAKIMLDKQEMINVMDRDDAIVICIQKLPDLGFKIQNLKKNIFVLNTEQLTRKHWLAKMIETYKKGFNIIDYSKENIDIMTKEGVKNIIYFPYIYKQDEIYNLNKTGGICGIALQNTTRRRLIMNIGMFNNIKINNIIGWKENRDKDLFKHRIILNISAGNDYNVFESIRCYRCLFNKMIVVSEEKYKKELIDYADHMIFANIKNIPKILKDVEANYEHYYKKLGLDNVNYTLNNHCIDRKLLIEMTNLNK